jgi:hypothetical protein
MPKLLKHPRCQDFYFSALSQGPLTLAYVKISAKYNFQLSLTVKEILKNIRKRSFYKALESIKTISNIFERNYLTQILYSSVIYVENNHYANLLKLWVDDIYIKKTPIFNTFRDQNNKKPKFHYYIILVLGFEYKDLPRKKESLW